MAEDLGKNPLLGDKTGLSVFELEVELEGIFVRTMGHEVAMRLMNEIDARIDMERRNANKTPRIVVIDEDGFWRGVASDTPEVRAKLRTKGFDVTPGLASKQWKNFDANGHRKKKEEV